MNYPKLTIVVPVYNTQDYLAKCLDSLIHQTFKGLEIICVNDGSTDNSLNLLNEYAANYDNIKILNQCNMGLAAARNSGMQVAKGEYITFVDSDDFLELNAYQLIFEKPPRNNVDIIIFGLQVFGNSFIHLRKKDEDYYHLKYDGLCKITDELILNTNVSVCNKIFKRNVITENQITFPLGHHYEDYLFYWMFMLNSDYAFFIPNKLYNYYRHNNSIMAETFSRTSNIAIDHLVLNKKLYDYMVIKKMIPMKMEALLRTFISSFWFSYRNCNNNSQDSVLKTATELIKTMDIQPKYFKRYPIISLLNKQKYSSIEGIGYNRFLQRIFSVKKSSSHFIIRFLGFKISFKYRHTYTNKLVSMIDN
jgi:glycosyltransferase involved in cell wall biosynthesis